MRAPVLVALLVGCSSGSQASSPIAVPPVAPKVDSVATRSMTLVTDGHGLLSVRSGSGAARLRWHAATPDGEPREVVEQRPDGVEVSLVFAQAPREVVFDVEEGSPRVESSGVAIASERATFHVGHGTWIDANGRRFSAPAKLDGSRVIYDVPSGVAFPATLDPLVSAEHDLDTPVIGAAPGEIYVNSAVFDGTNFLVSWISSFGQSAQRFRFARLSTTGDVLDGSGTVAPIGVLAMYGTRLATSGTESLLVWSDAGKLLGQRIGKDGKLLDATAFTIASSDGYGYGQAVTWDGTRYAVVYQSGGTTKLTHVTSAGAVVESTGVALTSVGPPDDVACTSSSCMVTWMGPAGAYEAAIRFSPTGVVGSSVDVGQNGAFRTVVSNGVDFFRAAANFSTPPQVTRVSSALAVTGQASLPTGGGAMAAAASATGYAIVYHDGTTLNAAAFTAAGGVTPSWSGAIGTVNGNTPPYFAAAIGGGNVLALSGDDDSRRSMARVFALASKPTTAPAKFAYAKGAPGQFQQTIASNGTDFLVTWHEQRDGVDSVFARRFGKDGAPLSTAVVVRAYTNEHSPNDLVSAYDGTRYHVAFRSNGGPLEHARIAADGTLIDATPETLDAGGYASRPPTIAAGGGRTLLTWIDGGEVFYRLLDDKGAPIGTNAPMARSLATFDPNSDVRLGASFDGKRFLVTWAAPVAASTDIYGAFVDDTGVGPQFSVASTPSVQHDPASAFGAGVHLVAWLDLRPDAEPAIHAVRVAPDGKVLDAAPITVATGVCDVCAPTVTFDGSSFVVAAMKKLSTDRVGDLALFRVRSDGAPVAEPAWTMANGAVLTYFQNQPALASDGKGASLVASSHPDDTLGSARIKLRAFEAKKPAGTTCAAASECDDGTCVDGVCCKTACTGPCEACDVPGSLGTCTVVAGAPHATRSCGPSGDACGLGACDGKDSTRCVSFAIADGGVCGAPTCKGTAYVGAPICSSARVCTAPATVECSPYRCAPTGCLKTCAADDDCVDEAKCVANSCVPSVSGAKCTDDGLGSVAKDGTVTRCAPYRCDTDGACAKSCVASSECVPGFVCDVATSTCAEAPQDSGSSGGCTMAHGNRSTGAFAVLSLLLGAVFARRTRSSLMLGLLSLLGCRSSENNPERREPVGQTASTLKASAVHTTSETAEEAVSPSASATACNASGCLLVESRPPWIVGQRIALDGTVTDAHGFIIAGSNDNIVDLSLGTDGTDYLLTWTRQHASSVGSLIQNIPFVVPVSAGGVAGKVQELLPAVTFPGRPAVGWDGKTWVVAIRDSAASTSFVKVVRIQKDGTHVNTLGDTVLTSSSVGYDTRLACDTSGCVVAVGDAYAHTGAVVHVVDGKADKGPTALDFGVQSIARTGTDLVLVGPSADGVRAQRFGTDGVSKAASKTIATGSYGSSAVGVLAGTPTALAISSAYPYPLTMMKLDASLGVTATSAPLTVPFKTFLDVAEIGGALWTETEMGTYAATSALAIARKPVEKRSAPHRFPAVATDGTTQVVAFARRSDGQDAVFVAKLAADGTFTPASGTLVANETSPIDDVTISWTGTSFLVGWTTFKRAAVARVSSAVSVLDPGGNAIVDGTGYPNGLCGIRFSQVTASTIAFVGGHNDLSLASVRIAATGKPIDTTPKKTTTTSIACQLATATSGDTTYLVYAQDLGGAQVYGLKYGADATAPGPSVSLTAPGRMIGPSLSLDGSNLVLVGSEVRPGSLGYDVVAYRFPTDFSGAPYTPWIVSARDGDQFAPAIATSGGKSVIAWPEELDDRLELRASLVDLTAKSVLVDAAKIDSFGPGEASRLLAPQFDGKSGLIVYERVDPDPSVLSTRIHARTITFGALGGVACTTSDDCELGPCVDGVCCDRACDGTCEACNEPGSIGKCTTVAGAPRGTRACTGTGCAQASCDGFEPTACKKFDKGFETKCAEPTCMGAVFTSPGYCDGAGACAVPKPASCAPYVCDVNGCRTSCSSDASCAMGFLCKDSKCVPPESKATCSTDGLSSIGVDNVPKDCAPYRCGAEGTCIKTCTSSVDCAPGTACDVGSGACSPTAAAESGGCAFSSGQLCNGSALALAWVALAALRRRRRQS